MAKFENLDTGEILTEEEARAEWRDLYDGEDPTNALDFRDQYRKVSSD